MKLKGVLCLAAIITISGCAGMSESMQKSAGIGVVTKSQSSFDSATEVLMNPAFVAPADGGTAKIKMGLTWRSSSPEQVGVLIRFSSLDGYTTIRSATLNVDGQFYELEPVEAVTSHDHARLTDPNCSLALGCSAGMTVRESDKMFATSLQTIRALSSAQSAKIKVSSARAYQVGDLLADSYGNVDVRDSLPEFLSSIP